jgi:hypothetical protein
MFPEAEEAKRLLKFTSRIVKGGEAVRGSIEPWGENWLLWLRRWRRQTPIHRNENKKYTNQESAPIQISEVSPVV